jgi:hypothetical protein
MMRVANFMVGVSLKTRVTERRSDVLCKHGKQMMRYHIHQKRKHTQRAWRGHATVVGWRRWRSTGAHSEHTGSLYRGPSQSLLHPPPPEQRQLRGVVNIEPNDEIRQHPAVLSMPSLVTIVSILDRFEWSGNWVVITPNLPSFAPHFNSCRAGSVDEHVNNHGARKSLSWSAQTM